MSIRHSHGQAGFSLIELMISLTLGLLVLGAAIAVFQSNQRTFSANEGQNRIQEGARVAYELISRDLRAAGGTACSNLAIPDVEHVLNAEETALLTAPVTGSGSEFTVTSGDDTAYPVTSATTSTVTIDVDELTEENPSFVLTDVIDVGDRLVLCNANQMYVVTATSVGADTIGFSPATPVVMTDDPMAPPTTVTVARFRSNRWSLQNGSLVVSRNGGAAQEVINGVTNLGLTYLTNGATTYTATPGNWANIIAVRVNLTLRGQRTTGGDLDIREAGAGSSTFIERSFSNVISLRSRTP